MVTSRRGVFEADHELFRSSVREFVTRELEPNVERYRHERQVDRTAWQRAGEQGFLGFMIPEEHGGGGVDDFRFNAVLGEELARIGFGFAATFTINTDVVAPYLLKLATDEQRKRWFPGMCTGETICAIAMTEPATGSDLAAVSTRAVKGDGGWVINGSKTFITNGSMCDLVVVVARTTPDAGSRGLSLFVVEAGTPGFERGRKMDKLGQHESDTSELFFDDAFVGPENLLGETDAAFRYLVTNLAQERLSCALSAVSHARAALDIGLEQAKERHAFGKPIGSFQHNKFVLAELQTAVDVTQAWVDRCLLAHVDGELDAVDAAKAKYVATEVQNQVADACLQLFGGTGYMQECPAAQAWLDARVTRIFAGTNEIMREVIGRSLGL